MDTNFPLELFRQLNEKKYMETYLLMTVVLVAPTFDLVYQSPRRNKIRTKNKEKPPSSTLECQVNIDLSMMNLTNIDMDEPMTQNIKGICQLYINNGNP